MGSDAVRVSLRERGWYEAPAGSAFGELIGPNWQKAENGVERYGFIVEEKHLNRANGLHGGMASAFLDMSLARTIADTLNLPLIATIHLGIQYIDVARAGDFVEVTAEIVRATRSVVFIRGSLVTGARVVAIADGVWKILAPRPQETA
jgi:uncharacterized protein (TIGR00369 family)